MSCREYDSARDRAAVRRIFQEAGWLKDEHPDAIEWFVEEGRGLVADLDGGPEAVAVTAPGTVRYLNEDVPFCCVAAVATSRVARRRGLAGALTAASMAVDAADGAALAGLGMFDQGFYNRLGFGTGAYVRRNAFDPAALRVEPASRAPRRLTKDDWALMHANRLQRRLAHGSCSIVAASTRFEAALSPRGFGLGFFDGPDGALSHHLWLAIPQDVEYGPYRVKWMAWRTREQFLELLGVLKGLGDQVHGIMMIDPPDIHMQSLLQRPFRTTRLTEAGRYAARAISLSWWQMRICDLPGCLARTKLPGPEVRFNLTLADPVESFLDDDAPWRGVAGEYVVTIGPESGAERGCDDALPTMIASVNAFTRLWLGVGPATGLAITDDLSAPADLLARLDIGLRLPAPQPDWEF
jgi:hypothetical protein